MTDPDHQANTAAMSPLSEGLTLSDEAGLTGLEGVRPVMEQGKIIQFLTIRLGGERYGVTIGNIVEILKYRPATNVPRADPTVHGIISLRGRVITVLDGRVRLGLSPVEITALSRIVVIAHENEPVGILVDEVQEVIKLPQDSIRSAPGTVAKAAERGIKGVCDTRQDSILIILDMDQFLRL